VKTAVLSMLSTSFWTVPAFNRVEPAITWAGLNLDRDVGRPGQRRPWIAGDRNPQPTCGGGALERAQHIRGTSACAYAHRHVGRAETSLCCGGDAQPAIVLLVGLVRGMGLHEIRGDAEGGGAFGGIESGHEPARSSTEVMEPPAPAQPDRNFLDRARHVGQLGPDRFNGREVFGMHQRDEIERRQVIELIGARMQVLTHGCSSSAAAWAQTRAEPWVATYAFAPRGR